MNTQIKKWPYILTLILLSLTACTTNKQAAMKRAAMKRSKGIIQARRTVWSSKPGKRIALLIGINTYADPDKKFHDLRYAESDVEKMKEVLSNEGKFDEIYTLTGEKATKKRILYELEGLKIKSESRNDLVFIYFSGHGTKAFDENGDISQYLVPHDIRSSDIPLSGLALDEVIRKFNSLASERKVLMLAACFSGGGKSYLTDSIKAQQRKYKSSVRRIPNILMTSKTSIILSSSGFDQDSVEEEGMGDIYTHFFIEALKNPQKVDAYRDGALVVSEIHGYASFMTHHYTLSKQTPTISSTIMGPMDNINLVGEFRDPSNAALFSNAPKHERAFVLVDNIEVGRFPGVVPIPTGKHEIALKFDGRKPHVSKGVDIQEGEQINASEVFSNDSDDIMTDSSGYTVIPVGFRVGLPSMTEDFSGVRYELFMMLMDDYNIGTFSFDWTLGVDSFKGEKDNLVFSGNDVHTSIMLNDFYNKNFRTHFGVGVGIGQTVVSSKYQSFEMKHTNHITPIHGAVGAVYTISDFFINAEAKYFMNSSASYTYINESAKLITKNIGYDGISYGLALGYKF